MNVNLTEYKGTLAAGGRREIDIEGTSVRCMASDRPFTIQFPSMGGALTIENGIEIGPDQSFKKVILENPGGSALTYRIIVANGARINDSRLNFSAGSPVTVRTADDPVMVKTGDDPVRVETSDDKPLKVIDASAPKVGTLSGFVTVGSDGETIPANPNRRSIRIQNISPKAVTINNAIWLEPLAVFETEAINEFIVKTKNNPGARVSVWEVV